jgi:hypothetical protein
MKVARGCLYRYSYSKYATSFVRVCDSVNALDPRYPIMTLNELFRKVLFYYSIKPIAHVQRDTMASSVSDVVFACCGQ